MYSQSRLINAGYLAKRLAKAALGRDHLLFPDLSIPKLRLGTDYGGWFIAPQALPGDRRPVVLSFGIGDDISFDLEMIRQYDARVYAFDPTPQSMSWLARQEDLPEAFRAFPIGVADHDGVQSFGLPPVAEWDNYSIRRQSENGVECRVKRIETIMNDLGVAGVDILKMDIEGSEYGVLADFAQGALRPAQLLVEFHHGMDGIVVAETTDAIGGLRRLDYLIFDVSPWGREFSLIHKAAM